MYFAIFPKAVMLNVAVCEANNSTMILIASSSLKTWRPLDPMRCQWMNSKKDLLAAEKMVTRYPSLDTNQGHFFPNQRKKPFQMFSWMAWVSSSKVFCFLSPPSEPPIWTTAQTTVTLHAKMIQTQSNQTA